MYRYYVTVGFPVCGGSMMRIDRVLWPSTSGEGVLQANSMRVCN